MFYISLFIAIGIIIFTTRLTQSFKSSHIWMLLGQVSASLVIILIGKVDLEFFNLIYGGHIELGYLTIPVSLLFLLGFTNVINVDEVQTPFILLLPCISVICLSVLGFVVGDSFVFLTGICTSLSVMFILVYSQFSGKIVVGRTITTTVCFIIAVLSLTIPASYFLFVYIPIFTLALPLVLYHSIQSIFKMERSIIISSGVAIVFSTILFVVPHDMIWNLVLALTFILVISQFFRRYRFI